MINVLIHCWPFPEGQVWKTNCFLGEHRLIDCLDYAHIRQSLDSRRLRFSIVEYAICEIDQFSGELIPFRKYSRGTLLADREFSLKRREHCEREEVSMIRKLATGKYRLYSRKKSVKTGKRQNLGTFNSRRAAEAHERAVQYFKHH